MAVSVLRIQPEPDLSYEIAVRRLRMRRHWLPALMATIRETIRGSVCRMWRDETRIESSPAAYLHRSSAWLWAGSRRWRWC